MIRAVRRIAVVALKRWLPESTWQDLRRRFGRRAASSPARSRWKRLRAMSLTELAIHFRTDKWGSHWYTPHYERHLGHLKDEHFALLEIGIGGYARRRSGGASLRMWKTFFPKARIIGLDVEDKSWLDGDRIRTYRGSQTDGELLHRIVRESPPLRVVIDDGSHRPADVRATFAILFPLLQDGGVYAIEDTQTSYWPRWGGSTRLDDPSTTMALVKGLLDGLNHEEFEDEAYEPTYTDRHVVAVHAYHNLVLIEKGSNAEGSNRRPSWKRGSATPAPQTAGARRP